MFDENSVRLTSTALFFYSVGMLGFALQEVLNKAFFSRKDSKTPMYISLGGMAVNVALSFTLSRFMGIGGLALAASVSATLGAGVSLLLIYKSHVAGQVKDTLVFSVKVIIMAVLAGFAAWGVKTLCTPIFGQSFSGRAILITVSAGCGLLVYGAAAFGLRLKEFNTLLVMLKIKHGD